ncbi:hypothetical protein [Halobaculum sp. MBLA0143]|uniref:DUF7266 family protein n=1 Tax=Halobaculum sp. MBLA0143 TaxID=3079933 RepID=UPI003524A737
MSDGEGRTRAVTPTVGKLLEVGIVVLLVGGLTATLGGSAVPEYRDRAGRELAQRHLTAAATRVERAVPPPGRWVSVRRRVPLPSRLRGKPYRVVADDGRLRLVHPNPAVTVGVTVVVPDRVHRVTGTWHSTDHTVVVVETHDDGVVVRLQSGGVA